MKPIPLGLKQPPKEPPPARLTSTSTADLIIELHQTIEVAHPPYKHIAQELLRRAIATEEGTSR